MADNISDANSLAKLISNVYTEVFQSSPDDPNTPISVSYHLAQGLEKDYVFLDCFRATLYNPSGITYKWGFASDAYSDDSGLSHQGVRWGFFGKWA